MQDGHTEWHRDSSKGRPDLLDKCTRGLGLHTIAIGGYALLTGIFTYPLVRHLTTHIPFHEDLPRSVGEHWMWMWAFWFVNRLIAAASQWSFFTDAIFYPRGLDLTYPTLFGLGLPLAMAMPIARFLGVILTYNLFILAAFILTAYATFLLVHYITNDSRAAFIAGLIFAFSPYQLARSLGHFGIMTSGLWIPLYILLLIKGLQDGSRPLLILAPLALVLTFFANPYYAIFLIIFTMIYVLYHFILLGSSVLQRMLLNRLLIMVSIAISFSAPVIWITLTHEQGDFHLYTQMSWASRFSADLLAFFLPSTHHSFWGYLVKPIYYNNFTGNDTEQTVYIGYSVLLFALVAFLKGPKEKVRFWSLSAFVFFVLSLGPFLHINGRDTVRLGEMSISLPLPNLVLHFIPFLKAMRVSSRFAVVGMASLAVMSGYGIRYLLKRFEERSVAAMVFLGGIIVTIGLEFSIAPMPLADARIPKIYEKIAQEDRAGTLLDVPLYWIIATYQYYQTVHQQRLLFGQAPRIGPWLILDNANSIPFLHLFRNPELVQNYNNMHIDRRDVLRFIAFFDLSFIVLHKNLLGWQMFDQLGGQESDGTDLPRLQKAEVFDRLIRFLLTHFPVTQVVEEGDIVVLQLDRSVPEADVWPEHETYRIDFGETAPQLFLAEGWAAAEPWDNFTIAWSNAHESHLWIYLPRPEDFAMELRLKPFSWPGSPPQAVKIFVNGRFFQEIELPVNEWQTYTVQLPQAYLTPRINTLRFVYRYVESPATVESGSDDIRTLGVAFDYITFHPQ